jgi:hypothetical protein
VKVISKVEGFTLHADKLKFVAGQFRRLHSKQLQQTFMFYSQQSVQDLQPRNRKRAEILFRSVGAVSLVQDRVPGSGPKPVQYIN